MIKYLEKDFQTEIKDKKILVDFYANWCGPCRMLAEVFEEIQDELDIDILKIDVDKFPELAREYEVLSIPTICLFNNQQVTKRSVGYLTKQELLDFIKK